MSILNKIAGTVPPFPFPKKVYLQLNITKKFSTFIEIVHVVHILQKVDILPKY